MLKDYHRRIHELKCWPQYYQDVRTGAKRFELRRDDRGGFAVGDLLILREWHPAEQKYTGYVTVAVVTCVVDGGEWLTPGYVALGIAVMEAHDA